MSSPLKAHLFLIYCGTELIELKQEVLKMKNESLNSIKGTLKFVLYHKNHPWDENKEFWQDWFSSPA